MGKHNTSYGNNFGISGAGRPETLRSLAEPAPPIPKLFPYWGIMLMHTHIECDE